MYTSSPVIAFDFDGVIASYSGFIAHDDVQTPNAEVVKAMKLLRGQGCKILIHSTRGDEFLRKYCEKFSIPFDYINRRPDLEGENPGKPIASVYVDDRTICYRGEDAQTLIAKIAQFKPYWKE
ncbi:TPA: hypothetical protein DIV48_01450 [Candidatus Kaiserbacteria bacterium]|nr:MAG: Adenylyl-sulfate kinase [Parcubacteria group bacterium GW2011_GWA1_56_13]KKW46457.1 MAG: Adenylyl-sulfate kinase [Parcubacteria group bacterium GW2011_GWB1_57_6]HCR52298.1 hypothetical protein [Candidatus Kaiserbacteria bacterium]